MLQINQNDCLLEFYFDGFFNQMADLDLQYLISMLTCSDVWVVLSISAISARNWESLK